MRLTAAAPGGYFTTFPGQPRSRLAAVDAATAALRTGFTGFANASVRTLLAVPDGSSLYVPGS